MQALAEAREHADEAHRRERTIEIPALTFRRDGTIVAHVTGNAFRVEALTHGTDLAVGLRDVDWTFDLPAADRAQSSAAAQASS